MADPALPASPSPPDFSRAPLNAAGPVRVVITSNEVNHRHGTGPLVERICKGWSNVVSIRARNDWGGGQEFGKWQACFEQRARERWEFFYETLGTLRGNSVESVLCVPYLRDDVLTALAVQKSFRARLCAYVMDDQNILTKSIPDDAMREFLESCTLRLATHPELKSAYEEKFGMRFHLLPAVVPAELVPESTSCVDPAPRRTALIGSFWEQSAFDRLCEALARCECEIDWFGNHQSPWMQFDAQKLDAARIRPHGVIPEAKLAEELRKYPFAIVPVAALDGSEANPGVARLSLPGRILFIAATSHTPVLVIGGEDTCGARFVRHFGIGESAPYDAARIAEAMDRLSRAGVQRAMREQAARIAPMLSDRGASDWLSASIELGRAADSRFEDVFAGYDPGGAAIE